MNPGDLEDPSYGDFSYRWDCTTCFQRGSWTFDEELARDGAIVHNGVSNHGYRVGQDGKHGGYATRTRTSNIRD